MIFLKRNIFYVLALALFIFSSYQSLYAKSYEWLTFKKDELEQTKKNIETKGHVAQKAYAKLIREADKAMNLKVSSVMDKTLTANSGDKRDYLSMSPYWWPNPKTSDGLPYIRKDGQTNPEVRDETSTDKKVGEDMCHGVYSLSIAYYLSGEEKYATKAAELVRVWFVDKATRMNPNLNYAQSILGVAEGSPSGMIEGRHFIKVIDSMLLLQAGGSKAWSASDMASLRSWFKEFIDWMYNSPLGFGEDNAPNNHGVWYNASVTAFLIFTDQIDEAKNQLRIAMRRERTQFDKDGAQPEEAERTRSYHYHCFSLAAWAHLIRYGILLDYPIQYRNMKVVSSRNVRSGVKFMLPYITKEKKVKDWPYKNVNGMEYVKAMQFFPLVREAFLRDNVKRFLQPGEDEFYSSSKSNIAFKEMNDVTEMLFKEFSEEKEVLLFPVMKSDK